MNITLVLPPLSQLNTPYPSVAYLARALREAGHTVHLRDLGLELMLRVFSRAGLAEIFAVVAAKAETGELPDPAWRALAMRERHLAVVEPVVAFLQGRDRSLGWRVANTGWLPLGPRLEAAHADAFGPLDIEDRARYLATLYLEDLADLVTSCVDPGFSLAQYQSQLASGPVSFDPIAARLAGQTLIDGWLDELSDSLVAGRPDLVGLSVPFPGTLYGALRIGARCRRAGLPVVMGGGYVNTELRETAEPRLWDCVDHLTLDDGEGPLLSLLDWIAGKGDTRHRTRDREGCHASPAPPARFVPAAWYADLPLDRYLQVSDTVNPTHRLWSDGRWNKITLAHGCYWKKCAFCDIHLDYIARYEPARISTLVDHMAELVAETGSSGFHFVDEAAPPRALRDLALELLRRNMNVTLWGNIRFERAFTPDLARLLAAAGLIAVTGGLEVASDRLLTLMDKGVTIEQAARAAWGFRRAGILVHAYLMYGFPTETAQETLDSAEVVRQMFAADLLTSAFWHRFVLTRHSEVYRDPARYKVQFDVPTGVFASNDIPHRDPTGARHERYDAGLVASLDAWMRGEGLERPLPSWFELKVPKPVVDPRRIARALPSEPPPMAEPDRLVWLGGDPLEGDGALVLFGDDGEIEVEASQPARDWLSEVLEAARPSQVEGLTAKQALSAFPGTARERERVWSLARQAGLVGV